MLQVNKVALFFKYAKHDSDSKPGSEARQVFCKLPPALMSLFSSALLILVAMLPASAEVLKGTVSEQDRYKDNQGLSRSEIAPPGDAFADPGSDDAPVLQAPKEAFDVRKFQKPQQSFPLEAQQQGYPDMALQQGRPAALPLEYETPNNMQGQQQPFSEETGAMQLAWDEWHKRVANEIYNRFNFLAKFAFRNSPPLICKVSYVVTNNGQITNLQMPQKSTNPLFNIVVLQAVKSLNGNMQLLTFPQGSRRLFVQKYATFSQNYGGDGFRYTTGDKEVVR